MNKAMKAAGAGAALALLAILSYQVRELAAALLIFAVAFCIVGAAVLLLIVLDMAAERGLSSLWHAHPFHVLAFAHKPKAETESQHFNEHGSHAA